MAQAWERLLLAFLQRVAPSIKDIRFPPELVFHQCAIISLVNTRPGMVRDISARLWALPWFAAARVLLFVRADTETNELSRAAWRAINLTDFTDDIFHDRASGRIAVDATGSRSPRTEVNICAESAAVIARRWKEYGFA